MTDRTPQADADVIREALFWIERGNEGSFHYECGIEALDRLLALLAEKDAQIEQAERNNDFVAHYNGQCGEDPKVCLYCRESQLTHELAEARAEIERLADQVRTLTEALDWLRFSLGSWAVYRERQPCAVFDSNEHRDVLDRIQSALASVQKPPAEEQT